MAKNKRSPTPAGNKSSKKSSSKKSGKKEDINDPNQKNIKPEEVGEKDAVTKKEPEDNQGEQPLEAEKITPATLSGDDESSDTSPNATCKCMQKKPGGKYYCFKLVQGRWIQSSAIPFVTKEFCEEICC